MKKRFFFIFLKRSFIKRLPKTLSCIVVLAFSTALVFYALNIQHYGTKNVEQTLRRLGPNLLVLPNKNNKEPVYEASYFNAKQVRSVVNELRVQGAASVVSFLYHVGKLKGQSVVVVGVSIKDLQRSFPYMQIQPRMDVSVKSADSARAAAWIGTRAAGILGIKTGQPLTVLFTSKGGKVSTVLLPHVIFSTGESEDDRIFVELSWLQKTIHLDGKVSLVAATILQHGQILSASENIIQQSIEHNLHGAAQVKLVYALAKTQASFVQSVSSFLWVVAWILLILSGCNVMATFMAIFYERMQEMALLKTLGAGRSHLFVFFFAESLLTGVTGGILGVFLGAFSLQFVFEQVFGVSVSAAGALHFQSFAFSFMSAIFITIISTFLPLLRVMKVSPTVALKGE